mmetsp:Transcript_41045/g.50533  ORF Transcript_41045/g.50533 Transcript_41045/m.50533 type:complete len:81 (-) Transcript_41045:79-321(-)
MIRVSKHPAKRREEKGCCLCCVRRNREDADEVKSPRSVLPSTTGQKQQEPSEPESVESAEPMKNNDGSSAHPCQPDTKVT